MAPELIEVSSPAYGLREHAPKGPACLKKAFVNLLSLLDLLLEFAFSHFPALPTVGIPLGSYVTTF